MAVAAWRGFAAHVQDTINEPREKRPKVWRSYVHTMQFSSTC